MSGVVEGNASRHITVVGRRGSRDIELQPRDRTLPCWCRLARPPLVHSSRALQGLLVRRLVDVLGAAGLGRGWHVALLVRNVPVIEVADTSLHIVRTRQSDPCRAHRAYSMAYEGARGGRGLHLQTDKSRTPTKPNTAPSPTPRLRPLGPRCRSGSR